MSPRENTGGDQLARLVHRGVGSSLRVMVQHARVVVVGVTSCTTMVPSMYDSAAAVSCLMCWVVREIEIEWSLTS